jgi:GNAT superfamily N-acetyltransferase
MTNQSAHVIVRPARPADLETLVDFNARLALETEQKILDPRVLTIGVRAALHDSARLSYWVAENAGTVVGQAAITREWSDWRNGWIWWLQSVYVHPDHRGRGVFRALYQQIRREGRDQTDVIGLRLYVERGNHAAQRTYESLGMRSGGYDVYEELWPERFNRTSD